MTNPLVTILMAIYKPNIKWLVKQLESLNNQTYSNLKLLVWNDAPDDETDYEEVYNNCITNFEYEIHVGKENLGSNGAFEELTKLATSEYVAYCDQDDVWLPEKIATLVGEAQASESDLLCSDMYVIDKDDNIVATSISKVRPRQIFYKGNDLFQYLFSRNFITGCTTLVKTEMAKNALPFPKEFVHDWWLGIFTSAHGNVTSINKPLIKYRIHSNNQTGVLSGVYDKDSYYDKRIKEVIGRAIVLLDRFCGHRAYGEILIFHHYAECRMKYFKCASLVNFIELYKLKGLNKSTTYFELLLPFMPNFIFKFLIQQIRKGNI